ncbi:hypothetical protein [Caldalkalibacillus salinus]|uniref:hypothetical protein n=1 Tax=Caldalkalibacillus salinus TaxID=2803787 RepID=UPI0019245793|nr:hypothetical protein [Caldalkalibacillus salinus]
MYKKVLLLGLVLIFVFSLIVMVSAEESQDQAKEGHPLYEDKEVLNYLFWTVDEKLQKDVASLQKSLQLSHEQMALLKNWGLKERLAVTEEQYNQDLTSQAYNTNVQKIFQRRNLNLKERLDDKFQPFEDWIETWWEEEKEYRKEWLEERSTTSHTQSGTNEAGTQADAEYANGIYATQYYPNESGAYEVALPDKYLKFANLGWTNEIPPEYRATYSDPPYVVDISNRHTDRQVNGVPVDEVGPWNTDDNYWNSADGDNPRRMFTDLRLREPEAYAAYYNNYNDGKDQFDRNVSNPAGIDLTPHVASDLGLGLYENAWVDVRYVNMP